MAIKLECTHPNSTSQIVRDGDIRDGINLMHTVNSEADLSIGQATSACLKFTTPLSTFQLGTVITYYEANEYTNNLLVKRGKFTVDTIEKQNDYYTVTAYDDICKFDINIDGWLQNKNNISIKTLFQQLCALPEINVPCVTDNFVNSGFTFYRLTNVSNITGRALLQYIASIAGGFARIHTGRDSNFGKVEIAYYENHTTYTEANPISFSDYIDITIADYKAPAISAVRCVANDQICVMPNSGTRQELIIDYNPILNLRKYADISGPLTNIYNKVSAYGQYKPCTFTMYDDPNINCGDMIYVRYIQNDTLYTDKVLVMSKEQTSRGIKYSCTGNSDRQPTVTTSNDKINQLLSNSIKTDNDYVSYNWLSNNTTKVFNSNIQCNDIIMSGLGYEGNTGNKSLLAVIHYILDNLPQGGGGGIITETIDLSKYSWDDYGNRTMVTFTTPITSTGKVVVTTGSVGYSTSGTYITLFNIGTDSENGMADGTATIYEGSVAEANKKAVYTCGCYTTARPIGEWHMGYPSSQIGQDWENGYSSYSIWYNGNCIAGVAKSGGPVSGDINLAECTVTVTDQGYIQFIPSVTGIFKFDFNSPVDYRVMYQYRLKARV